MRDRRRFISSSHSNTLIQGLRLWGRLIQGLRLPTNLPQSNALQCQYTVNLLQTIQAVVIACHRPELCS